MRFALLLGFLALGVYGEEKELIMLEIEPLSEKSLTKRQAAESGQLQYISQGQQAARPQQYLLRTAQQQETQVPAEYLSLLQQLQAQQGLQSQQVNPSDIQQLLVSRNPQQYQQQPQRRPLSPEAEQQRQLQLGVAQKALRQQEVNDAQRQSLRQYYQQQNLALSAAATAAYQLQQQPQQQAAQPAPQQYYTTQLVSQPQPQRQQYYRIEPQEPERVSYAQVQFGDARQELAPQPKPKPQPQQQVLYTPQPQQVIYQVPRAQVTTEAPTTAAPPQQYLIETTKVEPQQEQRVVAVPRPQLVYYRPQANYQDLQRQLLAQQQQAQYFRQQQEEPRPAPQGPPSRSAIYVTKSTPDPKQAYIQVPVQHLGVPSSQGRPLTPTELKALESAGFRVGSSPYETPEYISPYSVSPQRTYYRGLAAKRQSKRVPKPVELSNDEREALAQQGIRNLYRVETAESKNTPVTYVLALDNKPKSQ